MTLITYRRTWTGMKGGRAGYITQRQTAAVLLEEGRGLAPHSMLGMDLGGLRQSWEIEESDSEGTCLGGHATSLWVFYTLSYR